MATLEVDPDFNIHTSYHNDFFLLRTRVLVNGENTEIKSVREGKYEGPVLNFCRSGSTVSTKLSSISRTVSPILVEYGVYHVDTFYYEQSPLFHVVFSSQSCLRNFILAIEEVKSALEPKLQSLFCEKSALQVESAQQLTVEVQPDLFLVSPNRQETKGAEVHLATVENCSSLVTHWKNSKLFDFGALYQEKAKPPMIISQPLSQKDVLSGKSVAFSVQATGTQPVGYQWQWKQFGEGEKDEWQNLSGDSSTFKVKEVQASNAGYYRCVVSNSAGSETSQHVSLTTAPKLADLVHELQEVNDWVTLGLYLGIKMYKLKEVKEDYQTLAKCRTQMLDEWQNNVTPTWSAVVLALVGIGKRHLAYQLAQKHGAPPPELPDSDPLDHPENILQQKEETTASKLHEEIQKSRDDLEQDRRKLVDAEEHLRQSQESKVKANERASEAVTKLEELHENVEKISEEKNNLEKELKIKERECELLCAMQEKDAYNQVLQKKIDKKRKKIKSLKKELQIKESELRTTLQEAQTKQKELSEAQKVLKKQHEQVIKLQREKEELACSYNTEKEKVSKIVQILISDKDQIQQQLDKMKEESDLKSQQIEACKANIRHRCEEIEVLSSSLQEKEATAAQLQSELQTCQQVANTPEQLLGLLQVRTQIAELEHKLQEAEYKKLQVELEREATIQEMKAMENLNAQLHAQFDKPPKLTSQPEHLSNVVPGTGVLFTVQATGTDPLNFHWQWKPAAAEECESEEWQMCDAEWSDGAALTIPSVQKSNEGSYRCIISNYAGTQTSNPAQLTVADPPRITTHPQELKDVVPGKPAMFSVEATGTEPLSYKWEWNPAGERCGTEEWQPCDLECFPGGDSSTVTIPSVQKYNEGSYRCVISNCAGSQISKLAQLSVADPPRVTTHPQELKSILAGKGAMFSVEATGNEPLSYKWQWKPAESEEWQLCDAQGSTLTIPSVQKSNEGSYCCVINNYAGEQTSNLANLTVAEPPRIITHPQELKALQKTTAKFTIQAIGTEPLSYLWHWKPAKRWWMWGGSEEWKPCDSNTTTLTIPSVQKSNEGSYRCVVRNCAGSQISNSAELETCPPLQLPLQLRWRRCRDMECAMTWYPRCVVLERRVYVGGGYTYSYDDDEHIAFKYDPDTDNWSRLPRYQYKRFAVSIINSHLTLVGGCDDHYKPTNQLAVYEPSSQHWTYPYHPMPTPRYRPAVVMYDIWLLVAGGSAAGDRELATVELFNMSTNQWLAASSLPTPCSFMTSATINNLGYFVTDSKQVYRVSLPDIVSQTVDQSTASKSPTLWRRLPDTPLSCSTAISLRGYLIAVGGHHDNRARTDIHLYQPESKQWTKVGDLPNARQYCSCVVLPSGELMVAGGGDKSSVRTSRVDVASVLN